MAYGKPATKSSVIYHLQTSQARRRVRVSP
jgi:hypothetical protein